MVEQSSSSRAEPQDAHFRLLCLIEQHPEYSQRRLADAMGISLGKAHYLLKALFNKGLVKAAKFGRSKNKLSYLYVLTPAGVGRRIELTRDFLRRKESEFVLLRSEIEQLRAALRETAPGVRTEDA